MTQFDKLAKSYAAMVSLTCSMQYLRHLISYRAQVELEVKLSVTNFHSGPMHGAHRPVYWFWLTRIDKIEASLGKYKVVIDYDRIIEQSECGLDEISSFIAQRLSVVPESSDTKPPLPDEQENDAEQLNQEHFILNEVYPLDE
ncbi:hypothetical protein [Pectobacterium zantedeschiae]|uniref:hypothetical protein n=1 Tax=Pectobacterium zantedeschiae TaxID=2034769 RepID=UPI0018D591E2|nr:hypothetical protein [Pectobacterium zantedeschiae]